MYASLCTRPEIAFAVHKLAQFSVNPGMAHWLAIQWVLRYLWTTRHHALVLGGTAWVPHLHGWTDSDFGSCLDSRKSTSGYAFSVGGGVVLWSSKKQPTIATSTCEVEYVATCHASKEAIWLQNLLKLVGHPQMMPMELFSDNESTISVITDPAFHARSLKTY